MSSEEDSKKERHEKVPKHKSKKGKEHEKEKEKEEKEENPKRKTIKQGRHKQNEDSGSEEEKKPSKAKKTTSSDENSDKEEPKHSPQKKKHHGEKDPKKKSKHGKRDVEKKEVNSSGSSEGDAAIEKKKEKKKVIQKRDNSDDSGSDHKPKPNPHKHQNESSSSDSEHKEKPNNSKHKDKSDSSKKPTHHGSKPDDDEAEDVFMDNLKRNTKFTKAMSGSLYNCIEMFIKLSSSFTSDSKISIDNLEPIIEKTGMYGTFEYVIPLKEFKHNPSIIYYTLMIVLHYLNSKFIKKAHDPIKEIPFKKVFNSCDVIFKSLKPSIATTEGGFMYFKEFKATLDQDPMKFDTVIELLSTIMEMEIRYCQLQKKVNKKAPSESIWNRKTGGKNGKACIAVQNYNSKEDIIIEVLVNKDLCTDEKKPVIPISRDIKEDTIKQYFFTSAEDISFKCEYDYLIGDLSWKDYIKEKQIFCMKLEEENKDTEQNNRLFLNDITEPYKGSNKDSLNKDSNTNIYASNGPPIPAMPAVPANILPSLRNIQTVNRNPIISNCENEKTELAKATIKSNVNEQNANNNPNQMTSLILNNDAIPATQKIGSPMQISPIPTQMMLPNRTSSRGNVPPNK